MPPTTKYQPVSAAGKRKTDHDPTISPPPTKRKVQGTVAKSSVANFFTPLSQKPMSQVSWEERAPPGGAPTSLLVAKYTPLGREDENRLRGVSKQKIAAFDLDSTLITTSSGKKHADNSGDWKWWDRSIPQRLRTLHEEGYACVIFSNQGGLTLHPDANAKKTKNPRDRLADFKQKCSAILSELGLPMALYAATGKDQFRKPRIGMWVEMCKDLDLEEADVDVEHSIFVGDAGGRVAFLKNGKSVAKDFSCSDRNLASNVGIPYKTPDEYFLGEEPREFVRSFDLENYPYASPTAASQPTTVNTAFQKFKDQEVVVFCGPPGAGKSTFFRSCLEPLGFERVNQDTLKSKDRCLKAAAAYLQEGSSIAIDNTNPDPATRALWVDLANKHRVLVRCVWFRTNPATCEHNDTVRSLNKSLNPDNREPLPRIAFNGFFARFKEPTLKEGFAEITEVEFKFRGTKEEYALWGRYSL